ncbi:MAG: hypothetical protein ACO4CU_02955 [Ilumatobacteraceae bacterium]
MRLKVLAPLSGLVVIALCQTAVADGFTIEDGIGAIATSTTIGSVVDTTELPITCTWGDEQLYLETGRVTDSVYVYYYLDQRYWRLNPATGELWVQTWRYCHRGDELVSSGLEWRRVLDPDPEVLAEGIRDEVVRRIPAPEPQLSPPGPGVVQLGMWLAVVDPGPISVTARVESVWATTTAVLVGTRYDMGDGTVVTCAGAGDPIPATELDSIDPSPICGHVYRDVNERRPFPVTVTASWRVSWTGSGGVGGDLGSIERPVAFDYPVLEIQTVGTR